MINNYENVYILKGSLIDEQAKKEIELIKEYFKGAEIYEKRDTYYNGFLGRKKLAYNIKKEEYGYWYITYFKAEKEQAIEIEKKLKLNDNVMKFITLKLDEEE